VAESAIKRKKSGMQGESFNKELEILNSSILEDKSYQ
jgi:hypothetical protein